MDKPCTVVASSGTVWEFPNYFEGMLWLGLLRWSLLDKNLNPKHTLVTDTPTFLRYTAAAAAEEIRTLELRMENVKVKVKPNEMWDQLMRVNNMSATGTATKTTNGTGYFRFIPDEFGTYHKYDYLLFNEDELEFL